MIEVIFDDILRQDVDAIVNPANRYMLHGGGLAGVIAHTGGSTLVKASQAVAPIDTGKAIVTTAGDLPFRGVIHVVGPYWGGDGTEPYWKQNSPGDPDELLFIAHMNAIKCAWENNWTSVAFPAISCGVFRFPVERAAPIAIYATRKALEEYRSVQRVVFCLLDDDHYDAFQEALEK